MDTGRSIFGASDPSLNPAVELEKQLAALRIKLREKFPEVFIEGTRENIAFNAYALAEGELHAHWHVDEIMKIARTGVLDHVFFALGTEANPSPPTPAPVVASEKHFVNCPKCDASLRLPVMQSTLRVTCPRCRTQFYENASSEELESEPVRSSAVSIPARDERKLVRALRHRIRRSHCPAKMNDLVSTTTSPR